MLGSEMEATRKTVIEKARFKRQELNYKIR